MVTGSYNGNVLTRAIKPLFADGNGGHQAPPFLY